MPNGRRTQRLVKPGVARYQTGMLHIIDHPGPTAPPADNPPLIIAHGLYGAARNWGSIARALSDQRRVLAVDMRNHGDSPWHDTHRYPDLAADLIAVAETLPGPVDLLGHSMGGKAAMVAALTRPDLVRRLIVADIAPVSYDHAQLAYIDAMRALDPTQITRRSEAEAALRGVIDDPLLPAFFAQSLDLTARAWKLNLAVLARDMPYLLGFPEVSGSFTGPALFLTGALSPYVRPEHRDRIKALFPHAVMAKIPGAGHFLHAEKPEAFTAAARHFLAG